MLRIVPVALAVAGLLTLTGCPGPFGCGVGPVPNGNSDGGTVSFAPVPVGGRGELVMPFEDSADTNETIESITISGADASAFAVTTTFPLFVPAGQQVNLELVFSPTHTGAATAELTLNTEEMGPSPVALAGEGE